MILIVSEFLVLLIVVALGGTFLFFLLQVLEKGFCLNRKRAVYFSMKLMVCYNLFALFFIIPVSIWETFPKEYPNSGTFIRFYMLKKPIQYCVILGAYSNWIYCFFAFWLIGFGWNYFFHIYRKRSILHKLTKIRFCQKNPEIQKRKEQIAMEIGIRKEISIFYCEVITSPFVMSRHAIEIYLPKREFSEEEIEFIIKHELMHIKNKDILFQEIILYLRCFFWFNPLFILFQQYFCNLCELVCDELILERENEVRRFSYLCTIRSFLDNTSDFRNLIGFSSFNLVEQRILHVRQLRKQKKRFSALLLIGLIGIQVLGITALTTDTALVFQAKLGNWLGASRFTEVTNSYKEIVEDK